MGMVVTMKDRLGPISFILFYLFLSFFLSTNFLYSITGIHVAKTNDRWERQTTGRDVMSDRELPTVPLNTLPACFAWKANGILLVISGSNSVS
jgi:hypothetical protein